MFQWDNTALSLATKTLNNTEVWDKYQTFEKVLLLMPLLQSENIEHIQRYKLELERRDSFLRADPNFDPGSTKLLQTWLDIAKENMEVLKAYNRFPERNEILGRVSTSDEEAYLEIFKTDSKRKKSSAYR